MSTRKMIIGLCICLFVIVFAGRTLSQTRRSERARRTTDMRDWAAQRARQRQKKNEQWVRQLEKQREQEYARIEELKRNGLAKSLDEFKRQEFGVTEQQWKVLKPKLDKITDIWERGKAYIRPKYYQRSSSSYTYSGGFADSSVGLEDGKANVIEQWETPKQDNPQPVTKFEEGWEWERSFEGKAPNELTEIERICEELLELLEDENSTREEIENKVKALQKIRLQTKEQVAKAQQEVKKELNLRQEAMLVLMLHLY